MGHTKRDAKILGACFQEII